MIVKNDNSKKISEIIYLIKKKIYYLIIFILIFFAPNLVYAEIKIFNIQENEINTLINSKVKEPFSYAGLASFYNNVSAYIISKDKIKKIDDRNFFILNNNQSLAIVGHHKILIMENYKEIIGFDNGRLIFKKNDIKNNYDNDKVSVQILLKSDLNLIPRQFHKLKYVHLWEPLRSLCLLIEIIFIWLNTVHNFGWGFNIILLSFVFKIFTLPVSIMLIFSQRKVSNIQRSLASELESIKLKYSGEDAHIRFIEAHKAIGVTPFYNLRPLLFTLFPIPFLISIFNVLGESNFISGKSFLWIKDLAYPDAILYLSIQIPLLGNSINLLPIAMTLLSILGAVLFKNKIVNQKELFKQKINLFLMSIGFLILFYSFPSAMVLYWVFNNIWQLIQQKFISI